MSDQKKVTQLNRLNDAQKQFQANAQLMSAYEWDEKDRLDRLGG